MTIVEVYNGYSGNTRNTKVYMNRNTGIQEKSKLSNCAQQNVQIGYKVSKSNTIYMSSTAKHLDWPRNAHVVPAYQTIELTQYRLVRTPLDF